MSMEGRNLPLRWGRGGKKKDEITTGCERQWSNIFCSRDGENSGSACGVFQQGRKGEKEVVHTRSRSTTHEKKNRKQVGKERIRKKQGAAFSFPTGGEGGEKKGETQKSSRSSDAGGPAGSRYPRGGGGGRGSIPLSCVDGEKKKGGKAVWKGGMFDRTGKEKTPRLDYCSPALKGNPYTRRFDVFLGEGGGGGGGEGSGSGDNPFVVKKVEKGSRLSDLVERQKGRKTIVAAKKKGKKRRGGFISVSSSGYCGGEREEKTFQGCTAAMEGTKKKKRDSRKPLSSGRGKKSGETGKQRKTERDSARCFKGKRRQGGKEKKIRSLAHAGEKRKKGGSVPFRRRTKEKVLRGLEEEKSSPAKKKRRATQIVRAR